MMASWDYPIEHPAHVVSPLDAAGTAGEAASSPTSPAHIPLKQRLAQAHAEAEYFCETCRKHVESVNEADMCEDCHDAWCAKQEACWRPLYEGEKRTGLHGEHTREGIEMRLREMGHPTWASDHVRQMNEFRNRSEDR